MAASVPDLPTMEVWWEASASTWGALSESMRQWYRYN